MKRSAPVVTITFDRRLAYATCVCGWDWARRRVPSGPGEDIPARLPADLQVAAEAVAERHLRRTHLTHR